MKKPTFFILGAAKAGTTSLYYYLGQHPDVYMSYPKEPFFFEAEYKNGMDFYWRKYYKDYIGQKQVGEARHRNLYLPYVSKRIKESVPNAKFIVICRNPVMRAFSHYWYLHTRNEEKLSFEKAIERNLRRLENGPHFLDESEVAVYMKALNKYGNTIEYPSYIDSGYYAEQIKRYISLFGEERVQILFLEDLESSPENLMSRVFDFLDLVPVKLQDLSAQNRPIPSFVSRLYRHIGAFPGIELFPGAWRERVKRSIGTIFEASKPKLNTKTRQMLLEHFRPHNIELAKMTGRNLDHWDR